MLLVQERLVPYASTINFSVSATEDIRDESEYFRNRTGCFGECQDCRHTCCGT